MTSIDTPLAVVGRALRGLFALLRRRYASASLRLGTSLLMVSIMCTGMRMVRAWFPGRVAV